MRCSFRIALAVLSTLPSTSHELLAVPGHVVARRAALAQVIDSLPRRGLLGATLTAVPDSLRPAGQPSGSGMLVHTVLPGGTAAAAGLLPGDVIVGINQTTVDRFATGLTALRSVRAGLPVSLRVVRAGQPVVLSTTMQERVRERGLHFVTRYDHVSVDGGRIRVMVTEPVDTRASASQASTISKRPVLFLLGGIGEYSLDGPFSSIFYGPLLQSFAEDGWVTVRIDKPGQGDSEGGPTLDVGFDAELAIYRAVLQSLPRYAFIDTGRVFLFGHSMGGVYAPLIVAERPQTAFKPRGVAVYGTTAKTWTEYWLEALRRQLTLRNLPLPEVERVLVQMEPLSHYLVIDGVLPERLRDTHPELDTSLTTMFPDRHTLSGLAFPFWQQLAKHPVADAWSKLDLPVLALFGENDFVAARGDHELVAAIVNQAHPGRAEFRVLPGIDHGLTVTTSMQQSLNTTVPGAFNPIIVATLRSWVDAHGGATRE